MDTPLTAGARLRQAWSLRATGHDLLVAPRGRLRPLDGIRALSILWVVVFHAGWYGRFYLPDPDSPRLLFDPWMLPLWRGDFGVDLFFVLSGFLIAGMLLDERASRGSIALGRFYRRRLARLWPALLVALALAVVQHPTQASTAWATALYLTNWVPVTQTTAGWTWSLAIEEQFYLVCPWLLRGIFRLSPAGRLAVVGALGAALMLQAAVVVAAYGLQPADAEIVFNTSLARWAYAFDLLYDKPWSRAGALLCGVGAALVHRTPAATGAVRRGAPWLLVGGLGLMALSTHWPLVVGASRVWQVAYLAGFRTAFGLGAAAVLLVALSEHPVGRWLGGRLSSPLLYPVGQLAYAAYLVNPIVIEVAHGWMRAPLARAAHPVALLVPLDVAVTFAAALVLHALVERPFMRLRDLIEPDPLRDRAGAPGAAGGGAGP